MAVRGRVQVERVSWHWRWYQQWQRLSGKHRPIVDLCHYMRVILIFAPWRWFWQGDLAPQSVEWAIPPFVIPLGLAIIGALSWCFVAFTPVMLKVLVVIGLALAGGLIGGGGVWLWTRASPERQRKIEHMFDRIFTVLAWPLVSLYRGSRWLAEYVIIRPLEWFFTKRLFFIRIKGEMLAIQPWGILFILWLIAFFVWEPFWAGIVVGSGIGLILIIIGLVFLVVYIHDSWPRIREWAKQKLPSETVKVKVKVAKVPKVGTPWIKIVWQYLLAKKHRICPLIEIR